MKRFYKEVTLREEDGRWLVLLDEKPIRTPHKHSLALPNKALAVLVSDEWAKVEETIDPNAMPYTGLAHAAIDALLTERDRVIEELCEYGQTDLLYYRASEAALSQKQHAYWDPVLHWAEERYGHALKTAEGIMPIEQAPDAIEAFRKDVAQLNDWQLAGFTLMVHKTGSLLLSLAVLHERLQLDQALECAQLDETHQAQTWGEDEEAKARLDAVQQEIDESYRFLCASVD